MKRTSYIHFLICLALAASIGEFAARSVTSSDIVDRVVFIVFALFATVAFILNMACGKDK